MMIGAIGGYSPINYQYNAGSITRTNGATGNGATSGTGTIKNPGQSDQVKAGRKSSPAECQTCKERKYQDGSDENVSFKAPTHISPNAAGTAVRAHEQEHVNNAYAKEASGNAEVISCSVSIKTAVCPECGRTYVSGGTTNTQIKYKNEDNPYQQSKKSSDAVNKYRGMNFDMAV